MPGLFWTLGDQQRQDEASVLAALADSMRRQTANIKDHFLCEISDIFMKTIMAKSWAERDSRVEA